MSNKKQDPRKELEKYKGKSLILEGSFVKKDGGRILVKDIKKDDKSFTNHLFLKLTNKLRKQIKDIQYKESVNFIGRVYEYERNDHSKSYGINVIDINVVK